jgi:hypothetical protein
LLAPSFRHDEANYGFFVLLFAAESAARVESALRTESAIRVESAMCIESLIAGGGAMAGGVVSVAALSAFEQAATAITAATRAKRFIDVLLR